MRRFQKDEDAKSTSQLMEDLDKKAIDFIRPWFRKWKTQSIYQVLLLQRSNHERSLVYFCQQVHLYNQNDRYIMEILNDEISLNYIVVNPGYGTLISTKKLSVHKTPFKLSGLTFCDNSQLCDSVNAERKHRPLEMKEEWNAPLKSIIRKQTRPQNNCNAQDKECQTDLQQISFKKKSYFSISQCNKEDVISNPDMAEKELANLKPNGTDFEREEISMGANNYMKDITKTPKYVGLGPKRNWSLKKKTFEPNHVDNISLRNSEAITQKISEHDVLKFKSPIREMEEKFRTKQESTDDDDYPPYNFRALLRKTDYNESTYRKEPEPIINKFDFTLKKNMKKLTKPLKERQKTCTELAPGLIMEGETADL